MGVREVKSEDEDFGPWETANRATTKAKDSRFAISKGYSDIGTDARALRHVGDRIAELTAHLVAIHYDQTLSKD